MLRPYMVDGGRDEPIAIRPPELAELAEPGGGAFCLPRDDDGLYGQDVREGGRDRLPRIALVP